MAASKIPASVVGMTLNGGAQRILVAAFFLILIAMYGIAWAAPSFGLARDDGDYLVAARAIASGQGEFTKPPLFPAVLALFAAVSGKVWWLKALPLACTLGWLGLTWRLLRRMGASGNAAALIVAVAAASPTVIFLGTNLFSESLFALLVTGALAALLHEKPVIAGVCAGLATLTQSIGIAVIAACILTLVTRRKFRSGIICCAAAMVLVAPWLGWSLAHLADNHTSLAANERLAVLGHNIIHLIEAPFSLLTGIANGYAAIATLLIAGWCLIRRRELLPDLFLAIYSAAILCRIVEPQRSVAPVLPLVLWICWRGLHNFRPREAMSAVGLILLALILWADAKRLPAAIREGEFPVHDLPTDDWREMTKLFTYIRGNTPPDAVLLANLDSAFYLNTGRRTLRAGEMPDELSGAIFSEGVGFVAVTPDVGLAESLPFHRAVEALERGGILEPVSVPGLGHGYRFLRTSSLKFAR